MSVSELRWFLISSLYNLYTIYFIYTGTCSVYIVLFVKHNDKNDIEYHSLFFLFSFFNVGVLNHCLPQLAFANC